MCPVRPQCWQEGDVVVLLLPLRVGMSDSCCGSRSSSSEVPSVGETKDNDLLLPHASFYTIALL